MTTINGQATPAQGGFFVEFGRSSFRGRFGCNHASGQYRVAGEALVPAGLTTTEMACEANPPTPIPLMTYEEWGYRVLRAPMQMQLAGQRLSLSNSAGSVELVRVP